MYKYKIPTKKEHNMSFQDFVKKTLDYMFKYKMLSDDELSNLQNKSYCKLNFNLEYPLLETNELKIRDKSGVARYWVRHKFNGKYYGCSQWWLQKMDIYEDLFEKWINKIIKSQTN